MFEWMTERVEKLRVSNMQLTWLKILDQTFLIITSDLIMHNYKDILFYSGRCKAKPATFLSPRAQQGNIWTNVPHTVTDMCYTFSYPIEKPKMTHEHQH